MLEKGLIKKKKKTVLKSNNHSINIHGHIRKINTQEASFQTGICENA